MLFHVAHLLGSDYAAGVYGIGIVNALEVLAAFPGDDGLAQFRAWARYKLMNLSIKMMDFVFGMMNFVLNLMSFALKLGPWGMIRCRLSRRGQRTQILSRKMRTSRRSGAVDYR